MNKQINFEDTIFILNARMRMIRDLLRLDTDTDLFFRQTLGDMDFISSVLETLTKKFIANTKILDREQEADNLSDAEWQFSQLLNEFSNNNSPFSAKHYPETATWIVKQREGSAKRQKYVEASFVPSERKVIEPVVSQAEMNGLLGTA
ncbi:MAG: hypothetical protein LBH44_06860 [Treponema sp.]|nr:hypothetical protein [Treponema sp.]